MIHICNLKHLLPLRYLVVDAQQMSNYENAGGIFERELL